MKQPHQPLLVVFCGPNGAGKSTLRRIILGELPIPFVNADEIAKEHFGEHAAAHAYDAAQLAEAERQRLFGARSDFSFETVLSDPVGEKVGFLRAARDAGYWLTVHFVGLDSPAQSRLRVFQRVQEGGHDVPDEKIAARYSRVLENLARLLDVPDDLAIYDNSSSREPFRLLAVLARGQLLKVTPTIPAWAEYLDLPSRTTPQTEILP